MMVPIIITFINLLILGMIPFAFNYAYKGGVNSGVIASLFSTSALFSPILFFAIYNQRLTKNDIIGCVMIVASVVIIGTSGSSSESETSIDSQYLIIAVVFALLSGLAISVLSLILEWTICTVKYPPKQIFYDGNVLYGFIMLYLFLREQELNQTFTL